MAAQAPPSQQQQQQKQGSPPYLGAADPSAPPLISGDEDVRTIDTKQALQACGSDWDFLIELLESTLEDKEANLLRLRECVQRKYGLTDYRTISHAMKGAFLNLHLPALVAIGKAMEDLGKGLEQAEAQIVVNTLRAFKPDAPGAPEDLLQNCRGGNKDKEWLKYLLKSSGLSVPEFHFDRIFTRSMGSFWKHEGRFAIVDAEALINALDREFQKLETLIAELKQNKDRR